ncbi:MAG: carbohydrate ABC transporter permease [Treponema sp.]|nr:carbohydrate ABC transporter permease [Treponema sp.]
MTKKNKKDLTPTALNNSAAAKRATFWERNEASDGILLTETIKKYAIAIFRGILLFGMCFMIIQPILNKFSVSFMAEKDLYDTTIILVPKHFSLNNWKIAAILLNYKTTLFNTIWVSLLVSIIEVCTCSVIGYGFSRFQFPLKKFWFFCVILVIVIPPQTISTSLFLHFRYFNFFGKTINLRGNIIPYILLCLTGQGLKNGLYIFMIRQFFMGFPFELEEAAYVDGCGPLKTFFRIMIPGAKPIITSCFLFSFVWQWTDSFYSNLFLGKVQMLAISLTTVVDKFGIYLNSLQGGSGTVIAPIGYANAVLSTAMILGVFPVIVLYVFCQRLFVESLASTGVKM